MSERAAIPRPLPRLDGLNGEFYTECARQGCLVFQRCDACGAFRHPPRILCAACASDRVSWVPSTGRGTIFSWTVTHRATHPAFASEAPYAVVVTELEEGVRLVSGLRELAPAQLALGLAVEVALEEVAEGILLPFVRPRP
jgi:uncharacterized OB-fold protein